MIFTEEGVVNERTFINGNISGRLCLVFRFSYGNNFQRQRSTTEEKSRRVRRPRWRRRRRKDLGSRAVMMMDGEETPVGRRKMIGEQSYEKATVMRDGRYKYLTLVTKVKTT